jgi:hypothetical protein
MSKASTVTIQQSLLPCSVVFLILLLSSLSFCRLLNLYVFLILTNSVALVRERTIPTERPPLVGEVNANFCEQKGVAWSVRRTPYGRNLGFLDRMFFSFWCFKSFKCLRPSESVEVGDTHYFIINVYTDIFVLF